MPKSKFYSTRLERILRKWPGKRFGVYRFLPFFFCMGAGLEWFMINFKVGDANFYTTYKRRQAINKIEKELERNGKLSIAKESGLER